MSQDSGDPVIANPQEVLAVTRPKLVAAFQALRSLHSGATEPSYTVAYMLWADTTAALLKMRNSANTGWLVLNTLGAADFNKSASFTVDAPGTYYVDATSGAATATLPAVADAEGWQVTVIKVDGSGNAVTIDPDGAETVNGSATLSLASQYDAGTIRNNGAAWFQV